MDKQIKPWIIFSTLAVIFFSYLLLGWLAGCATGNRAYDEDEGIEAAPVVILYLIPSVLHRRLSDDITAPSSRKGLRVAFLELGVFFLSTTNTTKQ